MTARLLPILIDTAASALVLLPVFLGLGLRFPSSRRNLAGYLPFCLYLSAVFSATGVPSVFSLAFEPGIQPVPLLGIPGDLKNTLLNVLLFVPLGLFLPAFGREFCRWQQTACYAFGLSFAIEAAQLFTYRTTDVNDLIANTAGGLLGWWLARRLGQGRRIGAPSRAEGSASRAWDAGNNTARQPGAAEGGRAAAWCITGVFAEMVLLQPAPAAALWGCWYWMCG